MNYTRIALAAFSAFVAYFVLGGLAFTLPALRNEFLKYPAIYRSQEGQISHMPVGMAAMLLSMLSVDKKSAPAHHLEAVPKGRNNRP